MRNFRSAPDRSQYMITPESADITRARGSERIVAIFPYFVSNRREPPKTLSIDFPGPLAFESEMFGKQLP